MRCVALLGFFVWGFASSVGPSGGAALPPCPASCSCDGDGGVDCSGRGLTAVPEGLSAFTHSLDGLIVKGYNEV
ncbi:UNVERIFIED_CONTAM: Leucine-rich repeat-containing G-protein coupled receptor 4 [Gekko kuhli]